MDGFLKMQDNVIVHPKSDWNKILTGRSGQTRGVLGFIDEFRGQFLKRSGSSSRGLMEHNEPGGVNGILNGVLNGDEEGRSSSEALSS